MEKKKIVLFTTEPESFVQEKFAESSEKQGFELEVINPDECFIYLATDTFFANKGSKFEKADACIPRLSETNLDYKVAIMKHFEKMGVKVLNTGASMRTASNKIETQIILNNEGIKTPKTALFINEEQLDKALESIGGKFPVIVKTIFGTHGVGVMRADSLASLRSICQQLVKTNVEFMLQEYIAHEESARILVLGDQALAGVVRTIPDGDFRSNAHQGAELKKYDPTPEESEICIKAAKLVGTQFAAVDYIVVDKEIYLLEVNGSPGFEAMQEVIDFNIADKVIEFVATMMGANTKDDGNNKQENTPTEKVVTSGEVAPEEEEEVESEEDAQGNETEEDSEPKSNEEEEEVESEEDSKGNETEEDEEPKHKEAPSKEVDDSKVIEPEKEKISNDDFSLVGSVDKIVIKYFNDEKPIDVRIDTGAEYSSINGSDIDMNDETISFTFGDYRYRFSLLKSVKIVAANGKDKRPIIRLDIVVDGKTLHNVEFTVNDRGGLNYDVLLGRRALAQANVLVNPALVHLSTKSLNTVDAKTDSEQSKKEEE